MAFQPGQLVTPNLRLLRLLGEGGMGSVWVAEHLTLHTEVAVKCLGAELADNPEARARFAREAAAAAQIKSAHVVQTLDHGFLDDGTPFIVMEKLDGEDLYARIQRDPVPPEELAPILAQAAKALASAHARGIVHRDVKPENIFLAHVDGEVVVKVLDFGIAKVRKAGEELHLTTSGVMVGTPYYMSPEQVTSARDVDFRSDLWSLGVVAYHALSGKRPFEGETLGAVCVAIATGTFPPPSALGLGLPVSLDRWFDTALARDPAKRFGSAKELAAAFAEAVGAPASALAPSIPLSAAAPASLRVPGPRSSAAQADSLDERAGTMRAASFAGEAKPSGGRLGLAIGLGVAAVVAVGVVVLVVPSKGSPPSPAAPPQRDAPAATSAATPAAAPSSAEVVVRPASSDPSPAPPASSSARPKGPAAPVMPAPPTKTPDAPKPKDRGF